MQSLAKYDRLLKKYPSKLSFLENSYRKMTEKKKKVSMKSPCKYCNTIEMEDENPDSSLQWIRKHTSSGFDPYLNKNLSEQLRIGLCKKLNRNLLDWYMQIYFKIKL